MSNDLISRKEALNLIRSIAESRNLSTFECYLYGDIYDGIKNIETAYDVDAVCKELEESSFYTFPTFDEDGYSNDDSEKVIDVYKSIEIVRNGGKKE